MPADIAGQDSVDLRMHDVHALSDQDLVDRFTFLEEVRFFVRLGFASTLRDACGRRV